MTAARRRQKVNPLNKGKMKGGGKGSKSGKSAMLAALGGVGKPEVHEVPQEKKPKGDMAGSVGMGYWPPTLYLSEKDFPGIDAFKGKDKIVLVVSCDVKTFEEVHKTGEGKDKESCNASLVITAISDITKAQIKG